MKELGFENVALGRPAWQSSTSKWSKPNDAERALDDDGVRDFSFHTDLEVNPWWMVDLEDQYPIHDIVVGNRRKGEQHKAKTLTIEVSRDGKTWLAVHKGGNFSGYELTVPLYGEVLARFVRLSLKERHYFHLTKVEIWTRRSLLIVQENRFDGFGSRLQALLHAAYLSKSLNCIYRVIWPDEVIGPATEFSKDVKVSDRVVLGHSIETANEIFAEHFVKQNIRKGRACSTSKIGGAKALTPDALHTPKYHDAASTVFAPLDSISGVLVSGLAPNGEFGLADVFDAIPFSEKMETAIKAARDVQFKEQTAAVHIRSGDIIFGPYRFHGKRFVRKAISLSLAKLAIERLREKGFNIIVFGEDDRSLEYLRDTYGVTLAASFNQFGFSGAARAIFDITLMSRAQIIWSGESRFSLLARDISRTAKFMNLQEVFSSAEQVEYLCKDVSENIDHYHPLQGAFSLWSLFCISEQKLALTRRLQILDRAFALDPQNEVYRIAKASVLYDVGDDINANVILEQALIEGWRANEKWGGTPASRMIRANYMKRFHLQDLLPPILKAAERRNAIAMLAAAMVADAKGETEKATTLRREAATIAGPRAVFADAS